MPQISTPFGLKPAKMLTGAAWNEQANLYFIPQADTNAYFLGDAVRTAPATAGDPLTGAPAVTLFGTRNAAATTGNIRGVIVGVGSAPGTPGGNFPQQFDPNNLNIINIPAVKTQAYYVWVVDDPTVIFEAQADTIAATAYNLNAPLFVANAPVAPVNRSISFVQGSAAAATAALPLRIIGAPWRIDNDLVVPAFAKVYVKINNHELANGVVGA